MTEKHNIYPSYHFELIERLLKYIKRHDKFAFDVEAYRKCPKEYSGFGHLTHRRCFGQQEPHTVICLERHHFLEAIGQDMWFAGDGLEAGQVAANHLIDYGVLAKNSQCGVLYHVPCKGRSKREKCFMHVYAVNFDRLFS